MNRKGIRVAGLAAAAGVLALMPSAVGARGEAPPCPRQTLCLWKQIGYEGKRVEIEGHGVSNQLAQEMNNEASSYYNRRGSVSYLYEDKNGEGDGYCISPRDFYSDLDGGGFGNRASSTRLTPKDQCPV
jgi:hypothetical protein